MKPKEENSYRSILRGTSLFGGVQVFNILTGLVRGKLVAIFLGPAGMGISALFSTAGATIQQFASLGLNLAIVKEVSSTRDDSGALAATLAAARRLILLTALLGAVVCFAASPLLSRWSFGNSDYTAGFMLLSAMVFSDSSKLQCLNSIVHGAVRKHLLSTVASCGSPLFFFETAILYESGFDSIADDVWEVTAPKCERVARVKSRSGLSADEIDRRMASQKTPSFPHHRIIHNSSTDALLPQILALTNEQR
ncbi:MAG: dephospho-CoA kinase [Muribaculaceae bacterium]|nr:dephospho-CoA kinase [Muribaculaceae bacterium]